MADQEFYRQDTLAGDEKAPKKTATPEVPRMIGPYKIERMLEKGGMSLLYLGVHPETEDPLTIKVLSPRYLSNPDAAQRFLNEAEIIAMANHPNIVKLYGYDKWEGGLYIAMEFVQGESLRHYLETHPISLKRALEITIEIAYALCHLHTHGVIHRDLKPENILMTESGNIKVIDFGISQLLTIPSTEGQQQRFLGTPIYMSPEQREDPSLVSYPSDIYSLGILMYELVLGKLSHGQIHVAMMPKGLQPILSRMLQRDPSERYQDVVDLITDLTNYLNSEDLESETKADSQLHDMSKGLQQAQTLLVPQELPSWPKLNIGIAGQRGPAPIPLYIDFFPLPQNSFGIIIAEPVVKGTEGVVYMSMLRGMVRALCRYTTKPVELVSVLNHLLVGDDVIEDPFALSYLILNPKFNQFQYVSCGYGHLWQISAPTNTPKQVSAENMALGISEDYEFKEVIQPWHPGDTLMLHTFAAASTQDFLQAVLDNLHIPPQKQVDAIYRKIKAKTTQTDSAISLISIYRNE